MSDLATIVDENEAALQAPLVPEITPEQKLLEDIKKEEGEQLNNYQIAKIYLNQLVRSWTEQERQVEANRLTRDVDIDIDSLRQSGEIDDDEGFYPVRVIDNNIKREMPPYINFLKNSRRMATFTDAIDGTFDTDLLEQAFTKAMTYKGWTKPHYKVIDGAMTHGWASFEVVYDEQKPGHCGIEYIANEDLIYPLDSNELQTNSALVRRYRVTALQLKTWVAKFQFDLNQVNRIIEKYKTNQDKDKRIEIFKRFCKHEGAVYVSWFSLEGNCDDWLKKPSKHYVGIDQLVDVPFTTQQPVTVVGPDGVPVEQMQDITTTRQEWQSSDVNTYPIFICYYNETEKPYLFDHLGRVFYDKDKQEGQTAICTGFINRLTRSQNVYASPGADTVNDGKPAKQLANIKWSNGTIFDKPMQFWQMPPPDFDTLKAMEFLDTANSQEVGQLSFATMNREDSRKTATEIKAATGAEQLLNSVDLTLYSEFIRDVYSFCWLIVQSQAIQGKIKFLQIRKPAPSPMEMGASLSSPLPMQSPAPVSIVNSSGSYADEVNQYTNDIDTLSRIYDVRAAGDVDVIQKNELVAQMQRDWPVVQTTSLASRFLADYIKLSYPQDGALYAQLLEQGDPKNQVIMALGTIVQALVQMPEVAQHIDPAMAQQLKAVEQQAMQVLNPQANNQAKGSSPQPQQPVGAQQ